MSGPFTPTAGALWNSPRSAMPRDLLLPAALLLFATPALLGVLRSAWLLGIGAQTLLILVAGVWLLLRATTGLATARGTPGLTLALLAPMLILYVIGFVTGIAWLTWIGTCGAVAVLLYDRFGRAAIGRTAYPLLFLLCAVPPPIEVVVPVTAGVIAATSEAAVRLLDLAGLEVALDLPMLYVNQYELQMAEACAGLGTLFSLVAMMTLYLYLRHGGTWRYALLLGLLVVPVALFANLLRILLLALVIVGFGNAWAEGLLHATAGLGLFAIALVGLIAVDGALTPLRHRLAARA